MNSLVEKDSLIMSSITSAKHVKKHFTNTPWALSTTLIATDLYILSLNVFLTRLKSLLTWY